MASGQNHDKATRILSIPIALLIGILFGIGKGILAGIAFFIGGLWLSPDLDTNSNSLKRWGLLKLVWWPYRKLIPHRSFLSHAPFLGTTFRLLYLSVIALMIRFVINLLGYDIPFISMVNVKSLIEKYPQQLIAIIVGVEASAWLHLIQDGDSLRIKWHKKKNK